MTNLLVQEYLLSHSLEDLSREHGIDAKVHTHKFILNYNQFSAQDNDPIAKECRGLILRCVDAREIANNEVVGETKILSFPFRRFFNYSQEYADKINFCDESLIIQEKLDGSMITIHYDDISRQWCVSTRGTCEADAFVNGNQDWTFRSLFEKALLCANGMKFDTWTQNLIQGYTYCFELMTPHNQVVVHQNEFKLALLMVRNNGNWRETNYDELCSLAKQLSVPVVLAYDIKSLDELIAFVNSRKAAEHEGVVVCDKSGHRVKIKSAEYVLAHRACDRINSHPRNLLEMILNEQIDDVYALLNDAQKGMVNAMRQRLVSYIQMFECKWRMLRECIDEGLNAHEHRKQFYMSCNQHNMWVSPAMSLYEGKYNSFQDWAKDQRSRGRGFYDKLLKELGNA